MVNKLGVVVLQMELVEKLTRPLVSLYCLVKLVQVALPNVLRQHVLLQFAMDDSAVIEMLRAIRVFLLEGRTCLQASSN